MKKEVFFISIWYFFCFCSFFSVFAQENSVLSVGSWYKISVDQDGIYQITYSHLQELNLDLTKMSLDEMDEIWNESKTIYE